MRLVRTIAIGAVACLGLRSFVRTLDWMDDGALFSADVAAYPQSAQLNSVLGGMRLNASLALPPGAERTACAADAERYLSRAVLIAPHDIAALRMAADALLLLDREDAANEYLERAARTNPDDPALRAKLGELKAGQR